MSQIVVLREPLNNLHLLSALLVVVHHDLVPLSDDALKLQKVLLVHLIKYVPLAPLAVQFEHESIALRSVLLHDVGETDELALGPRTKALLCPDELVIVARQTLDGVVEVYHLADLRVLFDQFFFHAGVVFDADSDDLIDFIESEVVHGVAAVGINAEPPLGLADDVVLHEASHDSSRNV